MSERTSKNRPICITSYIICCPATFFRIVQSVRNPFITGFSIQHRLQGLLGKACFHIAPVVFCYITIGQIISITFGLPVTAMSTLEHIKVEPVGIIEPGCRHGSTKWVESHQMVLIDGTNCTCQGFPNFCFHIASCISSDYPHYIRIVLISFGKEGSVCFRFFYIHLPTSYQSSPDTYHTYIYTFAFSRTDDIIHMVPITIYSFFINMAEIESVRHGILSIDIHRGNSI